MPNSQEANKRNRIIRLIVISAICLLLQQDSSKRQNKINDFTPGIFGSPSKKDMIYDASSAQINNCTFTNDHVAGDPELHKNKLTDHLAIATPKGNTQYSYIAQSEFRSDAVVLGQSPNQIEKCWQDLAKLPAFKELLEYINSNQPTGVIRTFRDKRAKHGEHSFINKPHVLSYSYSNTEEKISFKPTSNLFMLYGGYIVLAGIAHNTTERYLEDGASGSPALLIDKKTQKTIPRFPLLYSGSIPESHYNNRVYLYEGVWSSEQQLKEHIEPNIDVSKLKSKLIREVFTEEQLNGNRIIHFTPITKEFVNNKTPTATIKE